MLERRSNPLIRTDKKTLCLGRAFFIYTRLEADLPIFQYAIANNQVEVKSWLWLS
jgi:hypothetical protein